MMCYGKRCWRKRLGYGLVMFASLAMFVDGLGYVAGFDGDIISWIFGDGAMYAGVAKIFIGGIGLLVMAMHCRCRYCMMAPGNMIDCDECEMCKDGCTGHEMMCDECEACKDGCVHHEM